MRKPTNNSNQNKAELLRQMQNNERMQKLRGLAKESPLGTILTTCLICGQDSDGKIRCEKHTKKLQQVWFRSTPEFMAMFKGQE
jgi:hypothetical protein